MILRIFQKTIVHIKTLYTPFSSVKVLVYYFNYQFWETKFHLSPFAHKVPEIEFEHHIYE